MEKHAHHWVLPTPDGRSWLPATCRICGAEKLMRAALENDIIEPAPHGMLLLQQSAATRADTRARIAQERGEQVWTMTEASQKLGIIPKRLHGLANDLGYRHRGVRWLTRSEIDELERRARECGLYDRPVRRRVSLRWA